MNVTAKMLSDHVKEKLIAIDEITIVDSIAHSNFIRDTLETIKNKCIATFGETLGAAVYDTWTVAMYTSGMSATYTLDGRLSNYHNIAHVSTMLTRCFKMLRTDAAMFNISKEARTILFLAIMYHDYGHMHGAVSDIQNVARALQRFSAVKVDPVRTYTAGMLNAQEYSHIMAHDFITQLINTSTMAALGMDEKRELLESYFGPLDNPRYFNMVCETIQYTQFPHLSEGTFDTMSPLLKRIRYLDMSTTDSDDWWQQIYEGLFLEMSGNVNSSGLEFAMFCDNQYKFVTKLQEDGQCSDRMFIRAAMVKMMADAGYKHLLKGESNGSVSQDSRI